MKPISWMRPVRRSGAAVLATVTALLMSSGLASANPGSIQVVKSPGGITAYLVESHNTPLITMRFSFKGGALQDPAGKLGLASLTSYMFNEGAGDILTAEFIDRRDRIGASLGGTADYEAFHVDFETVTEHKDEALGLLALAFAKPRFDEDVLERAKRELIGGLEDWMRSPGGVGTMAFLKQVYGEHRLALPAGGTPEGLAAITTEDVRKARSAWLARDNMAIGVIGDIDAATLGPLLDRLLEGLPAKAELVAEPVPVRHPASRRVIPMELPQSIVLFGSITDQLSLRERMASGLISSALNNGMSGRLFMEVREKRGLVYSVSADYGFDRLAGVFSGSFGSGNPTAAQALDTTLAVLSEMADKGMTEEEISNYKDATAGNFLLGIEGRGSLISILVRMQILGLPIDYIDTYVDQVRTITSEEIKAVARKMIDPKSFAVTVVGKPDPAIETVAN